MVASETSYTTFVTIAKIVLPLVALGLLSSLFLFNGPPDESRAIPYSDVELNEIVEGQRLGAPNFRGTLSNGNSVEMRAREVRPHPDNTTEVIAQSVTVEIRGDVDDVTSLEAGETTYDADAGRASGRGGVEMRHSSGLLLRTDAAEVLIDELIFESPGPVEIQGDGLTITAGRAWISAANGSENMILDFSEGVRVIYSQENTDE